MSVRPGYGKAIGRSALGWMNLGVAGTTLGVAAALGSWPILALGGAAYAALIAWDLTTPEFWKGAIDESLKKHVPAVEPGRFRDPVVRQGLETMQQGRRELEARLGSAPASVRGHLQIALRSLDELEERASRLAERAEQLGAYLAGIDERSLSARMADLEARAGKSTDAEARTQFEAARSATANQLATIAAIRGAHERALASLSHIAATFQGLPAQVMRLGTLDDQATDRVTGNIGEDLLRMNAEIGVFEETLQSIAESHAL